MCEFLKSQDGAISIDWVVAVAAIATLGMAVVMSVDRGTDSLVSEIDGAFMPFSMDLMNLNPPPTTVQLTGSSAYNVSQGGSLYAQVNCQHYAMSDGSTWQSCTQRLYSDGSTTSYWLDGDGQEVDAPT